MNPTSPEIIPETPRHKIIERSEREAFRNELQRVREEVHRGNELTAVVQAFEGFHKAPWVGLQRSTSRCMEWTADPALPAFPNDDPEECIFSPPRRGRKLSYDSWIKENGIEEEKPTMESLAKSIWPSPVKFSENPFKLSQVPIEKPKESLWPYGTVYNPIDLTK